MAKKAKKKVAAKKAAAGTGAKRMKLDDAATLTVAGEHGRRKDSRYGEQYEKMKRYKTVGAALKGGIEREVLRAAIKDKYVKVSGAAAAAAAA